jgi:hypothetical protein
VRALDDLPSRVVAPTPSTSTVSIISVLRVVARREHSSVKHANHHNDDGPSTVDSRMDDWGSNGDNAHNTGFE